MTVRELIVKLRNLNPAALVVAAKDSEGNGFSILSDRIDDNLYIEDVCGVREELYTQKQIDNEKIFDEFGNIIAHSSLRECVVLSPME